jgi:hypothetical protein
MERGDGVGGTVIALNSVKPVVGDAATMVMGRQRQRSEDDNSGRRCASDEEAVLVIVHWR